MTTKADLGVTLLGDASGNLELGPPTRPARTLSRRGVEQEDDTQPQTNNFGYVDVDSSRALYIQSYGIMLMRSRLLLLIDIVTAGISLYLSIEDTLASAEHQEEASKKERLGHTIFVLSIVKLVTYFSIWLSGFSLSKGMFIFITSYLRGLMSICVSVLILAEQATEPEWGATTIFTLITSIPTAPYGFALGLGACGFFLGGAIMVLLLPTLCISKELMLFAVRLTYFLCMNGMFGPIGVTIYYSNPEPSPGILSSLSFGFIFSSRFEKKGFMRALLGHPIISDIFPVAQSSWTSWDEVAAYFTWDD